MGDDGVGDLAGGHLVGAGPGHGEVAGKVAVAVVGGDLDAVLPGGAVGQVPGGNGGGGRPVDDLGDLAFGL